MSNGPPAAVARALVRYRDMKPRLGPRPRTPTRWRPQAQGTFASSGVNRGRPAVSRTLGAQTTAVKEQVGRPDQPE